MVAPRLLVVLCAVAVSGCISITTPSDAPAAKGDAALDVRIAWEPASPRVGEPVGFSAMIRSNQPGDTILALRWDIEGTVYAEPEPVHRFLFSGRQDVSLSVTTNRTGTSEYEARLAVLARDDIPPPTDNLAIVAAVVGAEVRFAFSWSQRPELVAWDFGDGQTSNDFQPTHRYEAAGEYTVTLRASSPEDIQEATTVVTITDVPKGTSRAHVIVGVPDSGINPYHEVYRRPGLTAHPCTYIPDFPCSVEELRLTLDGRDYQSALKADKEVWDNVRSGTWYWIPGTVFVAVSCATQHNGKCILDDNGDTHGTGTTSSVVMENPDVLIAFREGGPEIGAFRSKGIPVDIYSVSWGHVDPVVGVSFGYPLVFGLCGRDDAPLYVKSAGNEPGPSILTDCWSGDPDIIAVGGASAQDDSQYLLAGKDMDVVSYYCRPTASATSTTAMRSSYCGTSFSAPTVAGGLSKVVYAVRQASGYGGSLNGNVLDPVAGLTTTVLRDAMNRTASYAPANQYPNTVTPSAPLNPAAPWTQWGWGFYDGWVADATIDHFLVSPAPAKPAAAVAYMEAQYAVRQTLYG